MTKFVYVRSRRVERDRVGENLVDGVERGCG
jgi:hypothetical protein